MIPREKMMPIKVRGVVYANAYEVAAATGVALGTVYAAVAQGRADGIGLGMGTRPKPVNIAGQSFPSAADLARALGRSAVGVRYILRTGGTRLERLEREVKALAAAREAAERQAEREGQHHEHRSAL